MLKGFWLCLRRFPKPELIIFGCVALLVYAFGKAVNNYVRDQAVEVYEHMQSVSKENLEIILCPMPRVYGLRLTHFGESLPKFFSKVIFDGLIMPFMDEFEKSYRKKHPSAFSGERRDGILRCLLRRQEIKATQPLEIVIRKMASPGKCRAKLPHVRPLYRALEDGTVIKKFLDEYFGTLDEMLLEEYPGLLDQAWVLPYDNLTIEQMLDYVGVNLKRYIDEDMLRRSVQDIAGPSHTLEESLIDTRMAPNCFRHLFRNSEDQAHQRSKIVYQFRKSCPKEPLLAKTLLGKAPCLETADMYITVYITAYRQFSDVPAASVIVPYRVAADETTLLHVSAVKRIHNERCRSYGQEESRVTCIEDCLYEKMTWENQSMMGSGASEGKMRCRVPWIDRLKRRSNRSVTLPLCHTKEELQSTIQTIRTMFDITESPECSRRCPRHCDQLTITPRLAGSALTPRNRSSRITRHPRLEVLISDELPVFGETQQYDFGKMIAQMLGNLSFLVGVSLVALYDWLIGLVLWAFGKLPFIPAMPPLIKDEIYVREVCSCAETEEERRQSLRDTMDESETFLAASFRQHRRASMLRSFNPQETTGRRRRAMTLNQLPTMAARTSALDTIARTFPTDEELAAEAPSKRSSVDRRATQAGREESSQALAGEHADQRPSGELEPLRSGGSLVTSLSGVTSAPSIAQPTSGSAVAFVASRLLRGVLKKSSSRQVAPKEVEEVATSEVTTEVATEVATAEAVSKAAEEEAPEGSQRAEVLPSIAAGQARPRGTVTFDLHDVEKVLGPRSEETGGPRSEEERRERSAAPQYRSRPLRRRVVRARDSPSPDHDLPPADQSDD